MSIVMRIPPHKEKPKAVIHYLGKWIRGWSQYSERKDKHDIAIESTYHGVELLLTVDGKEEIKNGKGTLTIGKKYPEVHHYFIEENK